MSEQPTINWTRLKLEAFMRALRAAEGDTFTFEGHEFYVPYARYLAQYLDERLS